MHFFSTTISRYNWINSSRSFPHLLEEAEATAWIWSPHHGKNVCYAIWLLLLPRVQNETFSQLENSSKISMVMAWSLRMTSVSDTYLCNPTVLLKCLWVLFVQKKFLIVTSLALVVCYAGRKKYQTLRLWFSFLQAFLNAQRQWWADYSSKKLILCCLSMNPFKILKKCINIAWVIQFSRTRLSDAGYWYCTHSSNDFQNKNKAFNKRWCRLLIIKSPRWEESGNTGMASSWIDAAAAYNNTNMCVERERVYQAHFTYYYS